MHKLTIQVITFGMIFITSLPAYAYLDPGSGSLILQLLLGGLAGVITIAKLYWFQIKQFFSTKPIPNTEVDTDLDDKNKEENI